jgi:hypothetical protein
MPIKNFGTVGKRLIQAPKSIDIPKFWNIDN